MKSDYSNLPEKERFNAPELRQVVQEHIYARRKPNLGGNYADNK